MNASFRACPTRCLFAVTALLCAAPVLGCRATEPDRVESVARPQEFDEVEAVARDYIEGWYTGDAERMERSLHDDLVKRIPALDASTQTVQLRLVSKALMVDLTAGGGGEDPDAATQVFVDDVSTDIATARVVCPDYLDYLHLARTEDGWKIVNILFRDRE